MERHPMESDRAGRCYTCEAGGDRMATVTLAHLPPGWVAFACAKGNAGHIGPAGLAPPDRKRLPTPETTEAT